MATESGLTANGLTNFPTCLPGLINTTWTAASIVGLPGAHFSLSLSSRPAGQTHLTSLSFALAFPFHSSLSPPAPFLSLILSPLFFFFARGFACPLTLHRSDASLFPRTSPSQSFAAGRADFLPPFRPPHPCRRTPSHRQSFPIIRPGRRFASILFASLRTTRSAVDCSGFCPNSGRQPSAALGIASYLLRSRKFITRRSFKDSTQ